MSVRLGLRTSHIMKITVYVYRSAILSVRLRLCTCHVMKITVYVYGSAILSVQLGLRTSHVMKITVYGSAILSVLIQVVHRMNTVPNPPPLPPEKKYISGLPVYRKSFQTFPSGVVFLERQRVNIYYGLTGRLTSRKQTKQPA